MQLEIRLPLPNPKLAPNRKNGKSWIGYATAKKDDIHTAFYSTARALQEYHISEQMLILDTMRKADKLCAHFVFTYQTNAYNHDFDNALSGCKHFIDGVFQKIGTDDRKVRKSIIEYAEPNLKNPGIVITITDEFGFYELFILKMLEAKLSIKQIIKSALSKFNKLEVL